MWWSGLGDSTGLLSQNDVIGFASLGLGHWVWAATRTCLAVISVRSNGMEDTDESRVPFADRVNRPAWSSPKTLHAYDPQDATRSQSWTDPGERSALLWVAVEVRGQALLDIGVGGGRTVPFAKLLTDDYVAIDYIPEMIELCRRSYPGVDVRVGDARDLGTFEDNQFGMVMFSFNGIDAMDHEGRSRALREIHRVLRPGGLFLFSTHNKDGPVFGAPPWRRTGGPDRWSWAYRAMRFAGNLVTDPGHHPRSLWNWFRLRTYNEDREDWGMSVVEAHDFALVIHFITLQGQIHELNEVGFDLCAAFDGDHGEPIVSSTTTRYFHMVARKRLVD
jgi:SAM-dependent methyltransferase